MLDSECEHSISRNQAMLRAISKVYPFCIFLTSTDTEISFERERKKDKQVFPFLLQAHWLRMVT